MKLDVNKALEQIAAGLNTTVEKIYPALKMQAYIDGAFYLALIALILGGAYACYRWTVYRKKRGKKHWSDESDWDMVEPFVYGIALAIVGIFLIMVPFIFRDVLTAFLNTDYYIVSDILNKLRGGSN